MKVLLSAFACEPYRGSEPGVGWNIALELSQHHDVTVITSIEHKEKIETYRKNDANGRLPFKVVYHGNLTLNKKLIGLPYHFGYNLYALYWYKTVGRLMKSLQKQHYYEIGHHITWATFKYYDPICELGIPYIIGPVGGGELTPKGFQKDFSLVNKVMDFMRICHLRKALKSKKIKKMLKGASRVIATTPETGKMLEGYCGKCSIMQAIGLSEDQIDNSPVQKAEKTERSCIQLLFLGELKFWKGIDLLLLCAKELKERHFMCHFNIVGSGHDEHEFRKKISSMGLDEMFTFIGRISHEEAMEVYRKNDAFVYPSYHDSGALVVLEAMAKQIPVIVLDTGGPGFNVKPDCGYKVPVQANLKMTAHSFADQIMALRQDIINGKTDTYVKQATEYISHECLWKNRARCIEAFYKDAVDNKNSNREKGF